MRKTLLTLLIVAMSLPLTSAGANDEIVPTFRTERVFFECQDQVVKVNNVQQTQGSTAGWSTTPPSGAFAGDGDGCTSVEPTARTYQGVAMDTDFAGTFAGNLRSMRVTMHDISHRADTVGTQFNLIANVWVDGIQIVADQDLAPVATAANSGVTHEFFVNFNQGFAEKFAVEDGDGLIERDVQVQLRSRDANVFTWGASEVPSGIRFN